MATRDAEAAALYERLDDELVRACDACYERVLAFLKEKHGHAPPY